MEKVYHYTVSQHLVSILNDEEIKLSTKYVNIEKEKPVVFCTIRKTWEPTANKAIQDIETSEIRILETIAEHLKYCNYLARIEINPEAALYNWNEYVKLSGIDKKLANRLKKIARKLGSNVNEFRISFKPIKINSWIDIEILQDEKEGWKSIIS